MATPPIHSSAFDTAQPVLPALIRPRLDQVAALAETAQTLCLSAHLLPDGALTPVAAKAIGELVAAMRTELDAVSEAMRLKIVTLDCVAMIARLLRHEGMSESALYQRLARRGFSAADMRAAILAGIERGSFVRLPDPSATGKRGPTPHRLYWRQSKEST